MGLLIGGSGAPPPCLTFPQSLWLSVVADGIFAFFLLALSFSPALTTSLVSFLQVGQYLRGNGDANGEGGGGERKEVKVCIPLSNQEAASVYSHLPRHHTNIHFNLNYSSIRA